MFSSSFTISEQEHRQCTPYKPGAPAAEPTREARQAIDGTFIRVTLA